jgi:hypothetical protein
MSSRCILARLLTLLGEEGSSTGCCHLDAEDEVLAHVLCVDDDELEVGLEVVDVAEDKELCPDC